MEERQPSTERWLTVTFGDAELFLVGTGGTPSTERPEYYGGDIRWLKSGDVKGLYIEDVPNRITHLGLENSNARLYPPGTIVLAMSGRGKTRGTSAVLKVACACSQSVAAIVPQSEKVVPEFIHFNLAHRYDELRNMTGSMDRSGLNLGLIRQIKVPLPSISEQTAIARVLQAINEAKEARQRELTIEQERKAALMQFLFTHGTRGEALRQTEIGEMPESWQLVTLRDVCSSGPQNGAFLKKPKFGSGTLFVNVYDIYQNVIVNLNEIARVDCGPDFAESYLLKENDLLFVRSSLRREGIGQCCMVGELSEPVIFDCHLIKVSPNVVVVDPLYLTYFFLSEHGRRDLIARSKTTTMTTINQRSLIGSMIGLASLSEQREIANTLRACDVKIEALEKESVLLEELLRSLLGELMAERLPVLPLIESTGLELEPSSANAS